MDERTVLVVDSDAAIRASVTELVNAMGVNARAYASAEELLSGNHLAGGNCLVLEIRLQGMSGLELMESLAAEGIRLQTVVVTQFADVPLAVRIMKAGALTVLEKPFRMQDLWDAIRQALTLDARVKQEEGRLAHGHFQLASLRAEENRVLELILEGNTNKGIARSLSIGLRTVEARRQALMMKFNAASLAELVKLVTEAHMLQRQSVPIRPPINGSRACVLEQPHDGRVSQGA